jgi:hypothetical protein
MGMSKASPMPATEPFRPPPRFLSIDDVRARWSCGRTFVYAAIGEMERDGYLQRIWLGRVQRIAAESVGRWEALHSQPAAEPLTKGRIAALRAANDPLPEPARTAPVEHLERLAIYRAARAARKAK